MINILPSILTSDFTQVNNDINKFKELGINEIHLDVMDGNFVPAMTFGPKYISDIRMHNEDIKLDCHLMINKPINHISDYINAKVNSITVHIENNKTNELQAMQKEIKENNIKFGLAINPETNIKVLLKVLKKVKPDIIIIMSVHPGKGGQEFIPETILKAQVLNNLKQNENFNYELEIDGGVNLDNLKIVIDNKIERIVMGSAIYNGMQLEENYNNIISKIKLIAGN